MLASGLFLVLAVGYREASLVSSVIGFCSLASLNRFVRSLSLARQSIWCESARLMAGQIRAPVCEGRQNTSHPRRVLIEHTGLLANSHLDARSVLDRTLKH
jgi:hypothetical protein